MFATVTTGRQHRSEGEVLRHNGSGATARRRRRGASGQPITRPRRLLPARQKREDTMTASRQTPAVGSAEPPHPTPSTLAPSGLFNEAHSAEIVNATLDRKSVV